MNQPVTIHDIRQAATLYRVGLLSDSTGLWYDRQGRATNIIKAAGCAAAALPMDPHPVFRVDGGGWISTTDTYDALKLWFPPNDLERIAARGYVIQEIKVSGYRRLVFPEYTHEVYCPSQLIDIRILGNQYA